MKKFASLMTILVFGLTALAQTEDRFGNQDDEFKTIFQRNNGEIQVSGFGGPMMSFSTIDGNFAHMMGGGGGVIVNDFFFGGYGMGLTTTIDYKGEDDYYLDYGHGGMWVGYVFASQKPIHLSISSQFGWGSITRILANVDFEDKTGKTVFVVTPIAEVELNFSRYLKVGIGSSASFVSGQGISEPGYNMKDFIKPSVFLSFKFGWFN